MLVEDVLKKSGDFGPAQWVMLSLFSLVNVLSSFHYFAQTFITLGTDKPCDNLTALVNVTEDETLDFNTLTEELNWTCDSEWMAALVQSMFFVGSVVGTLVIGYTADRLGRRPMLMIANILAATGNLMTAYFKPNLPSLSGARFVAGLAVDSNFFMMYILVMEYISPGMRTLGLNLCIGVWYCIGCMAVPWLALACKDWRIFLSVISAPMLLIPLFAFLVPESAQWLLSRGRDDDAIDCFKRVAKINRKDLSEDYVRKFKASIKSSAANNGKNQGSIRGLFATPKLRKKTLILIFKTMVLTLCNDAMSRNIEGLGYDPFTMFTITSATIFPSCVVILFLQDRVGRKPLAVMALLVTGLFNFAQGGLLAAGKEFSLIAGMMGIGGRFAVNIAYNSGTQYAAELIPTQVRGQGLSAMHVIGYVAAFFSPHILYMSNAWVATPEVILGVLAVLGAFFCMLLPETLGRTLPVTLADGEEFGEDESVWNLRLTPNKKYISRL